MKELVVVWIKTGSIMILRKADPFFSEVEMEGGFRFLQAELGPISDFEVVGEL